MNQVRVCVCSQHSRIHLTGKSSGHAPLVSAAIDVVPAAPMPPSARRVQLASTVTSMVCMPVRFVLLDVTRWVLGPLLWEPAKFALLGSTKRLETRHVRNAKQEPSCLFQPMLKITTAPPTASNVLCERFRNIQDRKPVWIVQLRMLRNQPSVTATVPPVNTCQVSTPKQTAHRVKIALCAAKENLLALQTKRMGATYVCPDTTVSKYVRICYAKRVQEANTATVCQAHITTRCA